MKITLKDIAAKAGVSQGTVSRVLNGKSSGEVSTHMTERIRNAAAELHYGQTPTRLKVSSMLHRAGRKITLLGSRTQSFRQTMSDYEKLIPSITSAAAESGFRLEFLPVNRKANAWTIEWELFDELREGSGVIAIGFHDIFVLAELASRGCRIVNIHGEEFWGRIFKKNMEDWRSLVFQNRLGARMALEHLIASGCRRPATTMYSMYMTEPDYIPLEAYGETLSKAGIEYRNMIETTENNAPHAVGKAFSENPFDGLAASPFMCGKTTPLNEYLGIPDDIPVVYRNENHSSLRHAGAWIDYHLDLIGRDAVKILVEDDFTPGERKYEPTLVKGGL